MEGFKKGQINFTNLLGMVLAMVIFFTIAVPMLTPIIAHAIAYTQANVSDTDPTKDVQIMLYQLSVPVLFIGILITALMYALPPQESARRF